MSYRHNLLNKKGFQINYFKIDYLQTYTYKLILYERCNLNNIDIL